MYDPDQFSERREEIARLDKLLSRLQDCDLSSYDQDFVDDMSKRIDKFGERVKISPLQWAQIERMERQYGI